MVLISLKEADRQYQVVEFIVPLSWVLLQDKDCVIFRMCTMLLYLMAGMMLSVFMQVEGSTNVTILIFGASGNSFLI